MTLPTVKMDPLPELRVVQMPKKERGPMHYQNLEDDIATHIYMQFYSDARDALLKTVVE